MGKILSYKHGEQSVSGVDPRLWDSVQHAIAAIPYDAVIRSGSESRGTSDKGNHMEGYAIDVTLYDPQTGEKLPDTAKANAGASFAAYEQLAQATRVYQQQTYPELNSTLRWGGGFHQGGTPGDLMHLDITPSAKGRMAYYNWDTGLNSAGQSAFPKAKSNGGLADSRTVNLYKQSLAGSPGLIPPANVGSIAPVPMNRPAALSAGTAPQDRLGATAGDVGQGALSNTTTLGWSPEGRHTIAGETIRYTVPPADTAVARLTARNVGGVGSVADPNLSKMINPALERAFARLGAAVTAGTGASGTANLTGTVAPQPMPGRPPDAQLVKASAPQTIRVGQHDYQVGQSFDQGGMHYVVTPTGIQKSRIQTGEPTVMGGVIGDVLRSGASQVQQGLGTAADKASHDLGNMGTNIGKSSASLGNSLTATAGSIGSTLGNAGNMLGTMFNTKPTSLGASKPTPSLSASGYVGTNALRSSAALQPAVKTSSGVLRANLSSIGGNTSAHAIGTLSPRPAALTGGISGLGGVGGGVAGIAGLGAIGGAVAGNTSRTGTVTLAQLNAVKAPVPVSRPIVRAPVVQQPSAAQIRAAQQAAQQKADMQSILNGKNFPGSGGARSV